MWAALAPIQAAVYVLFLSDDVSIELQIFAFVYTQPNIPFLVFICFIDYIVGIAIDIRA